ncbi:MAG: hypothetical protein F6J95_007910 [Leptolyngbya sp. SIO1E4]|nr:hypothetical protein [Leptolyngbya sp. SIO1E4]
MDFLDRSETSQRIGKVVKSNSHCDYVIQVDDHHDVVHPPNPEDYGFGQFVTLEDGDRHWAVGLIYNSQLVNPLFLNHGPRLSSEPDPMFTPDLISETRTLLGVVLVGTLATQDAITYGQHGIPKHVVPVNTDVYRLDADTIYHFHCKVDGSPQFAYYSHLLRSGGLFAAQLTQQVLTELIDNTLFTGADQRALTVLCKELSWKNTLGAMR